MVDLITLYLLNDLELLQREEEVKMKKLIAASIILPAAAIAGDLYEYGSGQSYEYERNSRGFTTYDSRGNSQDYYRNSGGKGAYSGYNNNTFQDVDVYDGGMDVFDYGSGQYQHYDMD